MALKDILTNAKYADDMVLSLPDGSTATVGEMRALEVEERQALVARNNLVSQAEMELAAKFQRAVQAGWINPQTGEVLQPTRQSDAEIRRSAVTAAADQGVALDENDPLLGSIVREVRKLQNDQKTQLEALRTEMTATVGKLAGVAKQATGAYLDDFYATTFNSIKETLPSKAKVTLEDLTKFAEENNFKDKVGRYDLRGAAERMTFKEKMDEERERMRQEVTASVQKEQALAGINRPRGSALRTEKDGFKAVDEKGKTKTLDQALAEASQDMELFENAAKVASGMNYVN